MIRILKIIITANKKAHKRELKCAEEKGIKKREIIVIKIGNLPLHGIKLFVIIAMSLSLGESIIRQPTMPAALQPNPIHIVKACFPQVQHF